MHFKYLTYILSAAALTFIPACGNKADKEELAHHHHHHDEADKHGHHDSEEGDEHGDEIVLEPEAAAKFGVETEIVTLKPFNEILKVSGSIEVANANQSVVSASSAGIVRLANGIEVGATVKAGQTIATISAKGLDRGDTNAAAKATLDAARRELDRIRPLHDEGIVTTRDYNAALQAYEEAKAAYSGSPSGGAARAVASGVITSLEAVTGQFVESGQPIATIGTDARLTLKADVPGRYRTFLPHITSANIRLPYADEVISLSDLNGKLLPINPAASSAGYTPVYFSFDNKANLLPGTNVEVFLVGAPKADAISIPRSAIVEQQGNYYAYVKLDEECYDKRLVKTGLSDGQNIQIVSGLSQGDNVVVKGAIAVKLAESSGVVPEGHSHNH